MNRTPQITFGIKHSPLLGQLKPIEPLRPVDRETTQRVTKDMARKVDEIDNTRQNGYAVTNDDSNSQRAESYDSNNDFQNMRTQVTQVRTQNEVRSNTATPEPVQETFSQEIVWVPENTGRRGSYTIEKSDGNGFIERYENNEVVPVENGAIRVSDKGERGASNTEERSSEVIKRDGYIQNVDRRVNNAKAHDTKQKATEEVRVGTNVQHLPNGGIAKTTTTTTVKKLGTAAKTANVSTTVTRTNTAMSSRDICVN